MIINVGRGGIFTYYVVAYFTPFTYVSTNYTFYVSDEQYDIDTLEAASTYLQ